MSAYFADCRGYGMLMPSNCRCSDNGESRVQLVRWIKVPMAAEWAYGATEVLRWGLFIPSLGASVLGTKDLTHECIECNFTCNRCGKDLRWTYEFEISGKDFKEEFYNRQIGTIKSFRPSSLNVSHIKTCFDSIPTSSYSLLSNNCHHFAEKLYFKIKQMDDPSSGDCQLF